MIINDLFTNKKTKVSEGMAGKVVFRSTGADGGTYEIIQSGPTDFMIHANGKHIDTYGSLQRAMSVLQNEVPGLQQGMAEDLNEFAPSVATGGGKKDYGQPINARYMGGNKFVVGTTNNYILTATIDKYGLDWDDGWYLDSPGAAHLTDASEGEIPLPISTEQRHSIHDTVTDYLNARNQADLQKVARHFGHGDDGQMNEQGMAEAQTDYQKRRQRERDVDAGKPVKPLPKNPQNDYFARRKKEQGMAEQAPPINVPPGQQATTQPDGSTRISKPGSVSRADYAKNMAAYKAQTQTPEKIADFKQRMASGQGYTDTERQANLQQQQQHFGKFADTGDLDEDAYDPFANDPAADAKHEAEVRARMQQQLKQGKGTSLKDMPSIDRDQYLKNTNRTWDEKTQRSVPATKSNVQEVSLGDYRKKAQLSQAGAKINKFFGRDDAAKVAAADRTIANRERGLAGADARSRPLTSSPVDQDKQRRDLADKYPNIDELVRQAELNRDPNYDRAEGPAYYAGRDAEHNYHRLKQIQRMIRGAELDEMTFGGVGQTTDSATGDITTSFNQGPVSVSQTKTPGGYTKQTDQQVNLGTATLGARTVGPNIGAGQLAGTTTKTATNNMTGQAKQQVKGVGFGGASGATVGKNYVGASDDELARLAADSVIGINESTNRIRHLAGIKPVK